jgi:hypothetical protein
MIWRHYFGHEVFKTIRPAPSYYNSTCCRLCDEHICSTHKPDYSPDLIDRALFSDSMRRMFSSVQKITSCDLTCLRALAGSPLSRVGPVTTVSRSELQTRLPTERAMEDAKLARSMWCALQGEKWEAGVKFVGIDVVMCGAEVLKWEAQGKGFLVKEGSARVAAEEGDLGGERMA